MTLQEAIELNRNSFRLKAVTASCRITTAEHEIKYLRKGLFLAFLLNIVLFATSSLNTK
jgi:hypothetical protein